MYTKIEDIPSIVHSLRKTFQQGLTKDKDYRRQQLIHFQRFLRERENDIIHVLKKDLHKHELETIIGEIAPVSAEIDYMLNNLNKLTKTTSVKPHFIVNSLDKCTIRKEPKGVVLIIGSWNYPIHLLLLPLVGAIAAGNCVLLKPSEVASHTSEFIANVLPEYLDPHSYSVVQGGVEETTALLSEQFDHIFYTGNGAVGKIIMAAASKHLTPVTLELGGKSPVIIAPDANLQIAANRIIWGKLFNGGQICVAPDYVLIPKNNVNEFVDICRKVIYERFEEDPQKSDSLCRMVNERRFDALKSLIDSVNDPKKIVIGGQTDKSDLYIAPTVISPVEPAGNPLMDQEIFGPILPIVPVEDIDEAIRIVNSKDTPLALYIFTDDKVTREKILDQTQSGGVVVNDVLMHVQELALPFGGVGPSGMGSYHGIKSFETFTHERTTMIKSSGLEGILMSRYPPYSDNKTIFFTMLTMGLPEGWINKVKAIFTTFKSSYHIFFKNEGKKKNESKL
ncbi:Aldehyde/histidinol dehydrogenase [Cokeromyces recurvatus]|uniref:Aldehyde/histidinol dehydrogenase n=1 Tax=Cokeromyces recurvatus TaxID=90255 RepID=UPI00221FC7C7|nr:Aldehyde/histidinol dehydrogenase [Cokeromyces recurvatus]KAI7906293.1 Aldehyde/histidinol dehydrogenase [Cokeromyces recurvatus]